MDEDAQPRERPKLKLQRRLGPDEHVDIPTAGAARPSPGTAEAASPTVLDTAQGLTAAKARIVLIVAACLLLLGLLISVSTVLIGLAAGLVLSSSIWAGADKLGQKNIGVIPALSVLYGIVIAILFFGLIILFPAWQRQSVSYGERLLQATGKMKQVEPAAAPAAPAEAAEPAKEGTDELVSKVKETGTKVLTDARGKAAEGMTFIDSKTTTFVYTLNETTGKWNERRVGLFLQIGLLTAAFGLVPLIRIRREDEDGYDHHLGGAGLHGGEGTHSMASYGTPGRMVAPDSDRPSAAVFGESARAHQDVEEEDEEEVVVFGEAPVEDPDEPTGAMFARDPNDPFPVPVPAAEPDLEPDFDPSLEPDPPAKPLVTSSSLDAMRKWISEGYIKLCSKIGGWCMARVVKAVLLGTVVVIGFKYAGISSPLFIGGCVCLLAFFTRVGHLLGLVMALPMVLFADNLIWALGGLLIAWAVLFVAEKKLNWYLVALPALRAGHVPGYLQGGGGASVGGSLAAAMRFAYYGVRIVLSLAIIGALVYFGYAIVPRFLEDSKRDDERRKIEQLVSQNKFDDAIKAYDALLKESPGDAVSLHQLVRCYIKKEQLASAMIYADQLAEPLAEGGESNSEEDLPGQLYQRVRALMGEARSGPKPGAGYQEILDGGILDPEDNWGKTRELALKLLKLEPENASGLYWMIELSLLESKPDDALEYVGKSSEHMAKKDDDRDWHIKHAKCWEMKKDWKKMLEASDEGLKHKPENGELLRLKNRAARMIDQANREKAVLDTPKPAPAP